MSPQDLTVSNPPESKNLVVISVEGEMAKIVADPRIEEAEWASLCEFWTQYSAHSEAMSLAVPVGEFFFRRSWFKTHWMDLGNSVETHESVTVAYGVIKRLEETFDALSDAGYAEPSPELLGELSELGIIRPLTEAQTTNVASMLASPNGANFSVPGAGKTSTSLAVLKVLMNRGDLDRALVICPKSAFESWLTEPARLFTSPIETEVFEGRVIDPNTKILVVNFERVESAARRDVLKQWLSQGKSGLIIDEAHRVKRGASGRRWLACRELSAYATRVDLLTGTPMPQSYEDLRNLLSLSWRSVPKGKMSDFHLARLRTGGLFVRTTKGQLHLPEPRFHDVPVGMGPLQKELYLAITKLYAGTLQHTEVDQAMMRRKGRAVMTVLAAASNPALIRGDSKEELLRDLRWPPVELQHDMHLTDALLSYMSHEIPPKYEWVAKFVAAQQLEGKKVLVWSSFVGNLELLRSVLEPYSPAVIHGSVDRETRQFELDRFRQDPECSVLLTNPQTLGEGISLHETAHDAVFVDRTYNAAQYLQALDRIHRLGLDESIETNFFLLRSEGSIDERVDIRLRAKVEALSKMLNDERLQALSFPDQDQEDDFVETLGLDRFDLDDLVSHLRSLHD